MIKYEINNLKDKNLIEESFNNLALLVFGKNINIFKKIFEEKVNRISIYPQGTITKYLNSKTPGICRNENNNIIIEMLGHENANNMQEQFLIHEFSHELCHAFADLLPIIYKNHENGIIKNNILRENSMGLIKESNYITKELVGQHFYGKMFNETMMDIISIINNNPSSVDNILKNPLNKLKIDKTSYSIFTSITKLTILAFSNNGNIKYSKMIDMGYNIFTLNTKMNNGKLKKANDFLYGIMFDPLHIEEEFDKILGDDSYRIFCEYLDRLFLKSLSSQMIPSNEVKKVMRILPEFLNKKIKYYLEEGIINQENALAIINNFNEIWNSLQKEYLAFFNQDEINKLENYKNK